MIDVEKEDSIAVIFVNNPPMNVLCGGLLRELDMVMQELESDKDLRAVIITGRGRAFIAGADIKEMKDMSVEEARAFAKLGQGVLDRFEKLPVPVIAAVNGFALGGGTELALACDVRIASGAAKFGQPEVNLGVIPGFGGTQRLIRCVGPGKAKEMIYTGDIIDSQKAYEIGLVQLVVDGYKRDEQGNTMKDEKGRPVQDNEPVLAAAMGMAKAMASKGPVAISKAKEAMNKGVDMPLREGLALEAELFAKLFDTGDQKEGMDAFVNKRDPSFKGE